MAAIITLTTDFGLSDPYVAAVKGVILSLNPGAVIIDISHEVRPQCIEQAAFVLACTWPYFPAGTIHVAVVDPGVGTHRRAVALTAPAGVFVGPDNGILSAALPDEARQDAAERPQPLALPAGFAAYLLSENRFHRKPVSKTFHARDIFAPVAAHLSLGVPAGELGSQLHEVLALPPFRAVPQPDGLLAGRVIHIDRFGNLITDVRAEQLASRRISAQVGGRQASGLADTYAEQEGPFALIGSSGFLEIAMRDGSAARELGADIGEAVLVLSV